jgi:aspartate ammonia-lyase
MNANEVIANRALEMLQQPRGSYSTVNPNDHVNMSQSTNDVFPTTLRIAALWALQSGFFPGVQRLIEAFAHKGREFDHIVKAGRTHLQDAVPIRLGQEFEGYAVALRRSAEAVKTASEELRRVNIGATAVGTGINTPKGYRRVVVKKLSEVTGLALRPAENLIEITQSAGDFSRVSSALRLYALELIRIANDIRLLSSGPMTGLGEIRLPPVQPGSSIMPGKVNPSIAEMVDMVGFQVVGSDATIACAVQAGQLELNVMLPVVAHNLLLSIRILGNASRVFSERCVEGITANEDLARHNAEISGALVTALSPKIGYLQAADVVKESAATGRTIRQIVLDRKLAEESEIDALLDPFAMTEEP